MTLTSIIQQLPRPAIDFAILGVGILVLMILYAVAERYEHRRNKE